MDVTDTPAAPVITSVQCSTGGTLPVFQIAWLPQQGFLGPFSVLVTDSAGNSIAGTTTSATANGAVWTSTTTMTASTDMYYVQVGATAYPGVVSDKTPLLFAPITGITTAFDGVTLSVGWTSAASLTPAGTTQILLVTPAGVQAVVTSGSQFGQMLVAANLRGSGGAWSVTLTPQFGLSSGPDSDDATVYAIAPAVNAISVLGARTTQGTTSDVNLQLLIMVSGASVTQTSFVAALKADGQVVQTSAPFTGTWQQLANAAVSSADVQFAYPLNLAVDLEVVVAQSAATAGTAVGPFGVGSGLVLLPPQSITATVAASGNDRIVDAVITPLAGPLAANGSLVAVNGPAGAQVIGDRGYGFARSLTLTAPTIGGAYVLFAAQASGNSVGPWSGGSVFPGDGKPTGPGLPLITSIPALATIAVDKGLAALTWGAVPDAGLTGYLVTSTVAGAVVASGVFTGTAGSLAVAADGASFAIAGVAGSVTGPTAAAVPAITAAPAAPSAGWSSTGTQCTLQWQAPAGSGAAPDGYKLAIYNGATKVHEATSSTTSYAVPAGVLTAANDFTFAVAATIGTAPTRTGPWSAPAPIIAATPGSLVVSYDGAVLSAAWTAVPGAAGYRVVLLLDGAESGTPWFTAATATSAPLAFDSKAYGLSVQAVGPGSTGPAASAVVFGVGVYPQLSASTAAALIPANAPTMAPFAIAVGLPQIFVSPPTGALPATAPFSLAAGTAPYAYVLTIAGTANQLPWSFTADPVRTDLYTAYTTFLGQLETAGATPFGLQTVQAAIARAMPQTFAETLLYSYGFTGASGYAELRPGMVLNVEYESYLTMGGATPNQAELNGFVTSGSASYAVTRSDKAGQGFTALDAFIGLLTGQGGTAVPQPAVSNRKQAGGGGLIDSGYALMQQPFLRLLYPPSFPSTTQTGTPYPEFNALLIAASKLSDLTAATVSIRGGGPASANVGVLYFRGRTTLTPQIRVVVNDVEQCVPLGTTIGEILAERGMDPSSVDVPLTGLRVRRGIGPALVGSPAVYDVGATTPVRLDWAPSGKAALTALPLLGGDRIDLGGGARS